MAISTYTYSGITNPSSTHKIVTGTTTNLPPISGADLTTEVEITSLEYGYLTTSDNVYVLRTTPNPRRGFRFSFKIAEAVATITDITAYCEGLCNADTAQGFTWYIKNLNTPAWEQLATTALSAEITLSGSITSNIANYLDADGYLYLLAVANGIKDTGTREMNIDYVYAVITYTPPVTFIPIITIF